MLHAEGFLFYRDAYSRFSGSNQYGIQSLCKLRVIYTKLSYDERCSCCHWKSSNWRETHRQIGITLLHISNSMYLESLSSQDLITYSWLTIVDLNRGTSALCL